MSTIFDEFCRETTAFINPTDCIKPLSEFPEICITTFSQNIITEFIENNNTKIIANLYSANGILPVYEIKYDDASVGVFLSRVGAPACVVGLEEIIALGAKKIIQFGSCGTLNQSATENKIIIPTSAIRDVCIFSWKIFSISDKRQISIQTYRLINNDQNHCRTIDG